ncbi:hypothetical protein BCR41DRAFT_349296, partial [Lobosporangium transversale]
MFYYAFLHCFAFLLFFHLLFSTLHLFTIYSLFFFPASLPCYAFFLAASLPCYAFFFAASLPHLFSLARHFLNILSCASLRRFTFELSFPLFPFDASLSY